MLRKHWKHVIFILAILVLVLYFWLLDTRYTSETHDTSHKIRRLFALWFLACLVLFLYFWRLVVNAKDALSLWNQRLKLTLLVFGFFTLLWYSWYMVGVAGETHILRLVQQLWNSTAYFTRFVENPENFPPKDASDTEGKPFLSWRVPFYLEGIHPKETAYQKKTPPNFHFDENWQSEANVKAALPKPSMFLYPYYLESQENIKTCVVLNKEIADILRNNDYNDVIGHLQNKALILLVDPKDAVPWTAPIDASWKDLASGKITPYNLNGRFYYIRCGGLTLEYLDRAPDTYQEWEELCGVPVDLALPAEQDNTE